MSKIGTDLSKQFVFMACVEGMKPIWTGKVDIITQPWNGFLMLKNLMKVYKAEYGADEVIIEEPWARGGNPRPLNSVQLSRTATYVELAALANGLQPVFVGNSQWRKGVYGHGRPEDPKELARKFVADHFGYETKFKNEHNFCEAILIAHYGEIRGFI